MKLNLTPEQVTEMLQNTDTEYLSSRDSFGSLTIDETSNFPERLKFYMSKQQKNVNNLVNFFRANYPSLLSSSSSIHHYLRGIRTPKLSVLLGLAECLNIAPSNLLPGKAGNYMVKEADHVELVITKSEDTQSSEDVPEFNPTEHVDEIEDEIFIEPNEESDFVEELSPINDVPDPEDNNVVINDDDVEDDTDSIDEDTISIDEPSDDELSGLENEIEEGLDSFDDIFSDEDDDIYSTDTKDSQSDTMSWIKFTE